MIAGTGNDWLAKVGVTFPTRLKLAYENHSPTSFSNLNFAREGEEEREKRTLSRKVAQEIQPISFCAAAS